MYLFRQILVTFSIVIPLLSIAQSHISAGVQRAYELMDSLEVESASDLIDSLYNVVQSDGTLDEKAVVAMAKHELLWRNGDFERAIEYINEAIELLSNHQNHENYGMSLKIRSHDHLVRGEYDQSIDDIQKAIDFYQSKADTLNWAKCLASLSNINHDIFEYEQGIRYGHQSWDLLKNYSKKNPDDIAYTINCIAINHDDNGEYQKAIDYHMLVIGMMDELKNDRSKTRVFNNIGNSLMKLGRYDEAIGWLLKNYEINKKNGFQYGLATVKTNLGTLSYLNGQFENAKEYLDDAERISNEINDVEKIHDVLFQQSKLYESWGKFEQSLDYMKKFHFFKDSMLNVSKARQLAELQTKYETEKKEQQIALQQSEIAEQKAQNQLNLAVIVGLIFGVILLLVIGLLNRSRMMKKQALLLQEAEIKLRETQIEAAISSQEKERTRFAQDLHDGFGQMISILNLNLRSLEKEGSDREQIFEQSTAVLEDMYQELKGICFNLMPQTLIKNGIKSAIREFAARVNQTGRLAVTTDFYGMEDRLTELQEISLYRITQEWINNMLKYSDADRATVQITRDEAEITLMIEDNGAGFDLDLLQNGEGNGWKNMNSRTNLIKGELEVDTTPGQRGNTLIVNVPVLFSAQETVNQSIKHDYSTK